MSPGLSRHCYLAALVFLIGCGLRIVPWTSFYGMGYDESWYRKYLLAIDRHGLGVYPEICDAYLEDGRDEQTIAKVPPMRLLFVVTGWAWKRAAFGDAPPADLDTPGALANDPAHLSLRRVATLFGCLTLLAAWGFSRRMLGEAEALGVLALAACSPLLIHMSQHALIDGVYGACALLALWTLRESMQPEARPAWLASYFISFTLLVLAKENAVFPAAGFAVLMLAGKHCSFGIADRRHWFATISAGILALALLTTAAGGGRALLDAYLLFIRKVQALEYAQTTGEGPWSRYLIDLMIFTPATLCFAIGGGFRTLRDDRRALALVVFVAVTYAVMCNVRYGMNLRYTTIWVVPLCALAALQAAALASRFRRAPFVLAAIVAVLCAIDLAQYRQFFVKHRLYELPTADLLRAERVLK
jgi:4-amino-4-deoxy-L-arabinose transferase-like glycosyltransferase